MARRDAPPDAIARARRCGCSRSCCGAACARSSSSSPDAPSRGPARADARVRSTRAVGSPRRLEQRGGRRWCSDAVAAYADRFDGFFVDPAVAQPGRAVRLRRGLRRALGPSAWRLRELVARGLRGCAPAVHRARGRGERRGDGRVPTGPRRRRRDTRGTPATCRSRRTGDVRPPPAPTATRSDRFRHLPECRHDQADPSATRVIHAGEGQDPNATPLTAPIYQTSTFLFPSTEELVPATRRGRATSTSTRATATRRSSSAEDEARRARGRRGGARVLVGHGGRVDHRSSALASAGDEVVCSGAIYGNTMGFLTQVASRLGIRVRFLSLEETRDPSPALSAGDAAGLVRDRRSTRRCAASTSRASPTPCRERGVLSRHRLHLRESRQPATAGAGRRPRHAQRDEVPRRAQRHHGRRGGRAGGADRSAAPHAAAAGHRPRSRSRPGCSRAA